MNWKLFKDRTDSSLVRGLGSFVFPSFVLEVEPGFVLAARIDRSTGHVRRMGARELEADSLAPSLNQPNLAHPAESERTIREVAETVGNGNGRLGLLIPDPVVRVAILSFETLPPEKQEADALVRWRMKEFLPFAPEEARLSYQCLRREPEGIELLALAAKNSVLSEYETAVGQMNGGPALTLPATAALLPLLPEQKDGQFLIHLCSGWMTTVVVEGRRPRLWRTQDLSRAAPQDLARDIAREAARVQASARDHLQLEIGRTHLCARPPVSQELLSELAAAVSSEVEMLAPEAGLAAALPASEAALFHRFGATVAGLISNAGKER
jgi:hypothetical protein